VNKNKVMPDASPVQGFLWMSGAMVSFVGMAIAGRELSDTLDTFQILTLRSFVALLITVFVITRVGWQVVKTQHIYFHIFRNLFHFGGQFGWFLGISLLPLATVFALEYTSPVWTALLAIIFLGERLNRGRILAIGCGIVGVILILRPGSGVINSASFIVIGAAFCYAVSYISTKSMTKTEEPLTVLFYMNLIQFPLGLVPASFSWIVPTLSDVPWILVVGAGGFFYHYCLTRAFEVADTLTVIPLDFTRLPTIAIIGYFFYSEVLEYALLFGALVIFTGNYYNLYQEARVNKSS